MKVYLIFDELVITFGKLPDGGGGSINVFNENDLELCLGQRGQIGCYSIRKIIGNISFNLEGFDEFIRANLSLKHHANKLNYIFVDDIFNKEIKKHLTLTNIIEILDKHGQLMKKLGRNEMRNNLNALFERE